MPTYDYRCPRGHEFELFQRMSDPPEAECPECGEAAERQISGGAGFLFKGSGFYVTDYRSDSYRKAAEAEKKTSGEERGGASKSQKPETPEKSKTSDSSSSDASKSKKPDPSKGAKD